MTPTFKLCVVIPVYNHEHAVATVIAAVHQQQYHCVVVDDGSSAQCAAVLEQLAAQYGDDLTLLRLPHNQGKGAAVMAGLRKSAALGFTHALQVDADGQHDTGVMQEFVAAARHAPQSLICGYPVYDHSVPTGRLIARYITHFWVWVNTLSFAIKDSMCGFRVYPLASTQKILDSATLGKRMDFDPEIAIRLHWAAVPIVNRPIRVCYPLDGVSHFKLLQDNSLISLMHAKLFFGMLWRSPLLIGRRLWPR